MIENYLKQNKDIMAIAKQSNNGYHKLKITLLWEDKRDKEITAILRKENRPYALQPTNKGKHLLIFVW